MHSHLFSGGEETCSNIYKLKHLASGLMTIAASGAHRICTLIAGLTDTFTSVFRG